jgi:hypothetical protein
MKTWQTITVSEWMQAIEIKASDKDDLEKDIAFCALISGKTEEEIEALDWRDFTELKRKADEVYTKVPDSTPLFRWGKYRFVYDPLKINAGQYVSIQYFLNDGIEKNLHNLAACIVKPLGFFKKYDAKKHQQYANDLKNAPLAAIRGSMVFFCNLFLHLMRAIADEVAKDPKMVNKMELLTLLKRNLDGLSISNGSLITSE